MMSTTSCVVMRICMHVRLHLSVHFRLYCMQSTNIRILLHTIDNVLIENSVEANNKEMKVLRKR